MKICVVGLGFVGVANALALAKNHQVVAVDIDNAKVDMINQRVSPIDDTDAVNFLRSEELDLIATTNVKAAIEDADYVIIASPTNYDELTQTFDTSSVEEITAQSFAISPKAAVVIKSTIPIGFVQRIRRELGTERIFHAPEFLREGSALHDTLNPTRIVIGSQIEEAKQFAKVMLECSLEQNVPIILTEACEAESIKLFSNAYLAMRVAYINELDNFAISHDLDIGQIIRGMCLDPRIGQHYNNPSFGYGGYCLPKDTKQLASNYQHIPQKLITAIIDSNNTRFDFIIDEILSRQPESVGFYFLSMKSGSSNFRSSASLEIANRLLERKIKIVIYEPKLQSNDTLFRWSVPDLNSLYEQSDIILANRLDDALKPYIKKVYTRDVFGTG